MVVEAGNGLDGGGDVVVVGGRTMGEGEQGRVMLESGGRGSRVVVDEDGVKVMGEGSEEESFKVNAANGYSRLLMLCFVLYFNVGCVSRCCWCTAESLSHPQCNGMRYRY